jgi:hypothetical protein
MGDLALSREIGLKSRRISASPAVGILAQRFGGEIGEHADNKEGLTKRTVEECDRRSGGLPPINP